MKCIIFNSKKSSKAAFTLVEIALALGVAGFALVGIIGLVPVAVDAARDARNETSATFIAQSIVNTLRSGGIGKATLQISPDPDDPNAYETISLPPAAVTNRYLGYDGEGMLLGLQDQYGYDSGAGALPGSVFLARLILTPESNPKSPLPSDRVRIEVSVETPITASARIGENIPSSPW